MNKKINKKKWAKIMAITLVIVLIIGIFLINNPTVHADVGNNNRYDDSSTSTSSSSGDGFWLTYVLFELFGPIPGLILLLIIVGVCFYLKKSGKINKIKSEIDNAKGQLAGSISSATTFNNTANVADSVRAVDPAFSEDAFIGWVREVFVKIQQAWSSRNWQIIRPFESNELFSQHALQLQEYINNNKINMIEKINVNYCALREFRQDGDKEVMVVELHAIMRDYVIDATTRQVLESDPNKDWNMKYIMTFNRKAGVKTKPGTSNKSTTNCPNCGAPTDITSSGQCKYCDSVITTGEHDWVLSDIRAIQ